MSAQILAFQYGRRMFFSRAFALAIEARSVAENVPQATIRYKVGELARPERGYLIEENCTRKTFMNLYDVIKSVPVQAESNLDCI